METVPKRLASLRKDPWADFFSVDQAITARTAAALAPPAAPQDAGHLERRWPCPLPSWAQLITRSPLRQEACHSTNASRSFPAVK